MDLPRRRRRDLAAAPRDRGGDLRSRPQPAAHGTRHVGAAALSLALLAAGAAAQKRDLAEELEDWRALVRRIGGTGGGYGGAEALATLVELQGAIAAEAVPAARRQAAFATMGALAWRLALQGTPETRGEWTVTALFELAASATTIGGDPSEIATAHIAFAMRPDTPAARRRELLEHAYAHAGSGHYGPAVMLARLALDEGRAAEAATYLDAARALVEAAPKGAWLTADYHETRAGLHHHLGLPDLMGREIDAAQAAGLDAARVAWLRFRLALATAEFAHAVRLGEAIIRDHESFQRSTVRRVMARALTREPDAPSALGAARVLAQAALDLAADDDERAWARLELASLALDAGETGRARELLAAVAPDPAPRGFERNAELAVARARLALAGTDTGALAVCHGELLAVTDELLERWHALPPRPGGLGFLQFADRRDVLVALIAVEARLAPDAPERALAHLLAAQTTGTLARREAHAAGDPAAVQRHLAPKDGGILVFLPAALGQCVFAITAEEITVHTLPQADRLLPDLRRFRYLLVSGGADGELRRAGDIVLGHILPDAVRARLATWRSCAIVGRELLEKLAFEALPGPRGGLLGTELALWYLPSLPFGLARQEAARTRPAPTLDCRFVAATRDEPGPRGQPALLIARPELAAVIEPWNHAELSCGADAGGASLRILPDERTDLLCILGHGRSLSTQDDDERPMAIALADSDLRCRDVAAWAREIDGVVPRVVSLSVCGGETGPSRRGDDTGGHLAGAFLAAGADVVLAADADLDVAFHLAMLRDVHAALRAGCSVAEALRRARAAAVAAGGERAAARHHALFSAWGLGDATVRSAPGSGLTNRSWLLVAALVAAGALVAFAFRRRR